MASNCSQVPSYIVNAVTSGQFVDFNLLLPNNLGKLPSSMPNDVQLSRLLRTDLKKISDFRDWSEAWAVYTSILSRKTPEKVPDLSGVWNLRTQPRTLGPSFYLIVLQRYLPILTDLDLVFFSSWSQSIFLFDWIFSSFSEIFNNISFLLKIQLIKGAFLFFRQ